MEAIVVGRWPVQFIPVFDALTTDAVQNAEMDNLDGQQIRVVSAAYLGVIALSVGRLKDHLRVLLLLEAGAVTSEQIADLAANYSLTTRWHEFRGRYLNG